MNFVRRHAVLAYLCGLLLLAFGISSASQLPKTTAASKHNSQSSVRAQSKPAIPPRLDGTYSKLPLSFEANQGQTDGRVKFVSRGQGYSLFLTSNEAVLALKKPGTAGNPSPRATNQGSIVAGAESSPAVVRMQLVGANADAKIRGLEELSGKSNYFIGSDSKNWHTDVPNYAQVKYEAIYPGVDLVYYGNQRQLEYDFIVAPGSDPQAITLGFAGEGFVPAQGPRAAAPLRINEQGDLILGGNAGEVRLHKPVVYQAADGDPERRPGIASLWRAITSSPPTTASPFNPLLR